VKTRSIELKVGVFAAVVIVLLTWATIRVGDKTSVSGGGYILSAIFDNATGLKLKAPVAMAGVQIGIVKKVDLTKDRRARVTLAVAKDVLLPQDSKVYLRTRGFLGETYVEIVPGNPALPMLKEGSAFDEAYRTGDINALVNRFNDIADDVKHISGSVRGMVGKNGEAPINRIVSNLEEFSRTIRDVTLRNEANVDRISENLAAMTEQLKHMVSNGRGDVEDSLDHIASITRKIDEGKGTVGRLVNDEETVEGINEAVDNLNEALGGFKTLETEIGYHTEYLGQSKDFKHYVSLALKPSPDKSFLFDVIADPNPRPDHIQRSTDITAGGTTTTVVTDTATVEREQVRFSAQLAKKFYDFTLRGGMIESSGGLGLDYEKGPLGLSFSAFDFSTRYGERPHLKLMGNVNLTRNIYVLGGADDLIAPANRPNWFVGAGLRIVDEDIKSVVKMGGASLLK
jgi:phospholipid/cholesterol/gamma-HCH transport system substrate-binding protein